MDRFPRQSACLSVRPAVQPAKAKPTGSRPIKVLHVFGSTSRAGVQLRTLELLRHVDRRRYRFDFCVLSGRPGDLDEELRALGGDVHLTREGLPRFPGRFRELVRRRQYDVVHSHLYNYSGYLLGLAARCGTPVRVAHFRSARPDPPLDPARRLFRALLRPCIDRYATEATMRGWVDRHATNILGVSRWSLHTAWGPHWGSDPRCEVVYDGVEPDDFAGPPDRDGVGREFGLPPGGPLYVHVGRLTEAKNHLRLISIFAEVLRRLPTARLLLVGRAMGGRGAERIERDLHLRLAEQEIAGRVIRTGQRTDVPRLLKAADVLLFPSLWEGLGDVVLEACAAGTPTLASDFPSLREIGEHLPGVHYLSLDEPDAKWGDVAVQLAKHPPSNRDRQAALEVFTRSVFTVAKCSEALCRTWRVSGPEQ